MAFSNPAPVLGREEAPRALDSKRLFPAGLHADVVEPDGGGHEKNLLRVKAPLANGRFQQRVRVGEHPVRMGRVMPDLLGNVRVVRPEGVGPSLQFPVQIEIFPVEVAERFFQGA